MGLIPAIAATVWSVPAVAAPARVLTSPVEIDGELGAQWRAELDDSVANGLRRGNFEVVTEAVSCTDASCWSKAAARVGAAYVLRTEVTVGDRSYAVRVELLDGKTGERVALGEDACDVCGVDTARAIVADQAATMRTKLDDLVSGPPMVVIDSSPSEAIAKIDGETVGQTPVTRELSAGKHVVRLEKEGYVAVEREFLAVAGVQESMSLNLEPLPAALPRYRPWGWVGIGLGGAAIATGVTLMVLDERPAPGDRCQGDNVDADGNCRFRWNTLTPGLIFTTAGVLAALAGTAVVVVSRPRHRTRRTRSAWRWSGDGVVGRF